MASATVSGRRSLISDAKAAGSLPTKIAKRRRCTVALTTCPGIAATAAWKLSVKALVAARSVVRSPGISAMARVFVQAPSGSRKRARMAASRAAKLAGCSSTGSPHHQCIAVPRKRVIAAITPSSLSNGTPERVHFARRPVRKATTSSSLPLKTSTPSTALLISLAA